MKLNEYNGKEVSIDDDEELFAINIWANGLTILVHKSEIDNEAFIKDWEEILKFLKTMNWN